MFRQQDMAFADALEFLHAQLTIAFSTEDIQEGVKAFFEKREPVVDAADERRVVVLRCRTSTARPAARAAPRRSARALGAARRRAADRRLARRAAGRRLVATTCATRAAASSRPAARSTTRWPRGAFPVLTSSRLLDLPDDAAGGRAPRARTCASCGSTRTATSTRRHDAERLPRRHVPGRRVRALGRGLDAAPIDPARVVMCGVRDLDSGERVELDFAGVGDPRASELAERLRGERVYVHLDLDVLDPDVLPSQFPAPRRAGGARPAHAAGRGRRRVRSSAPR